RPLAAASLGKGKGFSYWKGINGALSGRERNRQAKRATHLSRYPMEQVRRVDKPTTLILEDEVPRVPKRAAFFERALRGDLGPKAQRERHRFAFKQPHSLGMMSAMRHIVPLQGGEPADVDTSAFGDDPAANSQALKSIAYMLGADLTGICEAKPYTWYSHDSEGKPLPIKHKYAVVMLIDQEYDTMEGASGDDWISGAQSMRGYLRGAEIAGVMADTLRRLGFSARSQTNVDSDVLHIPLLLLAGLGELSRIGELVLNPYVGPRFKSVVLTTDMPLEPDKPIDFGLQYFCSHCWKCARECPCDAIPLGDKMMFNGYEIWKPDVDRCARYRLTNSKGSACGRCMKTCPLNKVVTADGPLLTRIASWCGVNAFWLKPILVPIAVRLDDWVGNGKRNPVKKWWLDLEVVDGVCVLPSGTNTRDIDVTLNIDPAKQKMAVFPANVMPVPNDNNPQPADRKAGMAQWKRMETPAVARARAARGEAPPDHYRATPPDPAGPKGPTTKVAVYSGATGREAAQ
ncbi:MAG: NAD-binding oxidoreductase, partial [Alphaproteobacteria bacterium]|nr:NAD-binding oxidoreductase [Alphaproteobacteria bacterium]